MEFRRPPVVLLVLATLVSGCAGTSPGGSTGPAGHTPGTGSQPGGTALTTDGGRDPGGIPTSLDGQPVHIGLAAAIRARASTDDGPFLVGGWFNDASAFICSGGIGRDPSPLLTGCATGLGGASPVNGPATTIGNVHVFWDGRVLPGSHSPAILRVHAHDARAAACRADARASCEAVVVVEDVLWTGDAWTRTEPVSVVDAVRTLGSLSIQTSYETAPNEHLSVTRDLFATALDAPCPDPWPNATFAVHGDARFALLAVFPDEAARAAAQSAIDPQSPGCASDARIRRAGAAGWAADRNVLALVYGEDARARMQGALDGTIDRDRYTPFPPEDLDEGFAFVDDALAARAAGIEPTHPPVAWPSGDWATSPEDAYARFEATALTYVIGDGRPVVEGDIGSKLWKDLLSYAVPGTATLYRIDHPASTDPALRTETFIAYRLRSPAIDRWQVAILGAQPGT